jgi:hypothetical protein
MDINGIYKQNHFRRYLYTFQLGVELHQVLLVKVTEPLQLHLSNTKEGFIISIEEKILERFGRKISQMVLRN